MIKKFSQSNPIGLLDPITSAILAENNLTDEDFEKNFPDMSRRFFSFKDLFPEFTKLIRTDEFISFVNDNKDRRFCIAADYDCDGIMACVIMVTTLRKLGIECSFVVPNRLAEGYGMSDTLIDEAIAKNAECIITVDNGISCKDQIDYALSKGLKVFVTDHHMPTEGSIPEGIPIVDPCYNPDEVPGICGAFVAAKLCYALLEANGVSDQYFLSEIGCFAGIATITDMMPVLGENRLLLRATLSYFDFIKKKNVWNRVMKVLSGLGGSSYLKDARTVATEDLLGYYIGPNINAVSRVNGDVTELIDAIIDSDQYGHYINGFYRYNKERKENTKTLAASHEKTDDPVNIEVLNESDFAFPISGLMGLMANKIVSDEHKVSLVGCEKDGLYEFSCRSIPGYSMHDAFLRIKSEHPELQLDGGGHASAMGLRFPASNENLLLFRECLAADYETHSGDVKEPTYFELEPENIDEVVDIIGKFSIFGTGFRKPTFIYTGNMADYDDNGKFAKIGDYAFRCYLYDADKLIGHSTTVAFTINYDSSNGPYFKVERFLRKGASKKGNPENA